jgi:hypothetical protein
MVFHYRDLSSRRDRLLTGDNLFSPDEEIQIYIQPRGQTYDRTIAETRLSKYRLINNTAREIIQSERRNSSGYSM